MAENDRTALLIHCSREEAERIRNAAKRERRTISGYVLNAVISRLDYQSQFERKIEQARPAKPLFQK